MFTSVVKPMMTLIIIRRLYLIASLQTVEPPDKAARHKDVAVEWTLGLAVSLLIAGPLYYVVQPHRFEVDEGLGCTNSTDESILSILLLYSWSVILPTVSITVYYPRVARIFYCQSRDINRFLRSNRSVSRTNYFRILALANLDILLTLPIGIANIILSVKWFSSPTGSLPFYSGWTRVHADWEPVSIPYAVFLASGSSGAAEYYFIQWLSPVLAFAIFGLFAFTSEARASHWRIIWAVGARLGSQSSLRGDSLPLEAMKFREQSALGSISLVSDPRPISIDTDVRAQDQGTEHKGGDEMESYSSDSVKTRVDRALGSEARVLQTVLFLSVLESTMDIVGS